MNDSLFVSGFKRVSDLNGERQEDVGFYGAIADAVLQRHPIEMLHDNERPPVLRSDLVDRADVRVVQRGGSLSFAFKAAESLRVLGGILPEEIECEKGFQKGGFGLVGDPHPAASELLDDAIVGNGLPDH